MMDYRRMLKKRLIWLVCLNGIALILIVLTGIYRNETAGRIEGFCLGLGVVLILKGGYAYNHPNTEARNHKINLLKK